MPDEALRGKAVLVGVTLVGQYDQVVTPFRNVEAGIYAHAAMLSSILSGRFLQRGASAVLAELSLHPRGRPLAWAWCSRAPRRG